MRFSVLSVFPDMIEYLFNHGILAKALKKEVITLDSYDIRSFSKDKNLRIDDSAFGTTSGMLLKPDVMFDAIKYVKKQSLEKPFIIHVSPSGVKLDNILVRKLASKKHILFLASRYEGLDQRVIDSEVDLEVSIGDYVLTGGELPVLVLMDAISRFIPDVLPSSVTSEDSFETGLLEYPQYTKPLIWKGRKVPDVLREGNHQKIENYRFEKSFLKTYQNRIDLWKQYPLFNKEDKLKNQNKDLKNKLLIMKKFF